MQLEKPSCLPGDAHTEGEMCFLPQAPSWLTLEQERNSSAVCPQHPTSSSMHSGPPRPPAPIPIPLSKNRLTDPMTGKIILSAVSEEMRIFAQAYNCMLDTMGELIQIAEHALQS
ncbi:hypothetical protein PISMIDRAFT_10303 [Pisolithus microcarpus 441]|uniref:Uncharacterized protein n=1 Tax=Pisolithus microcarpus 441 TaxID=765257 RepID=A0A0C9ZPR6_9AGAM|nr:hypothetical protein PISMIDRAFT_10303 [Pisolithus microcarpus 441]